MPRIVLLLMLVILFWSWGCVSQPPPKKEDWVPQYRLGAALLERGEFNSALVELNKALEMSPREAQILDALGLAFFGRQDYPRAESYFKRALEVNPKFSESHHHLGWVYLVQGRFQEAIAEFDLTLADPIYPAPEEVYNNRGFAHLSLGNLEAAVQNLRRALQLSPDLPQARHNLGLALLAQDKVEEAIKEFEFALKVSPPSPELRFNLAQAYLRGNRKEDAVRELKEAVKISPDSGTGRRAQALLESLEKK